MLHISQPGLTKNIKRLENEFKCRLFERSSKGCSLTPSGEILYKYAKRFNADLHLLKIELEKVNSVSENITVAFGNMWLVLYASKLLMQIEDNLDDNKINITARRGSTVNAIKDLQSGDCDIFLGNILTDLDEGLTYKPLMETHLSIFAHEGHPLLSDTDRRLTLKDFSSSKWLLFGTLKNFKGYVIPEALREIVLSNAVSGIDSLFVILDILQKSDALIFLPKQVGQQLRNYNVFEISNHSLDFSNYTTGLIYRKDLSENSGILKVIEIISAFFSSQ